MTEGREPAPSDAMPADQVSSDPAHPDAGQAEPDPDTAYAHSMQPDPAPDDEVTTGHDEIDTAVRRLDELDGLPVEQHGEVYDELHGRLRDALTAAATPTSESSDA